MQLLREDNRSSGDAPYWAGDIYSIWASSLIGSDGYLYLPTIGQTTSGMKGRHVDRAGRMSLLTTGRVR